MRGRSRSLHPQRNFKEGKSYKRKTIKERVLRSLKKKASMKKKEKPSSRDGDSRKEQTSRANHLGSVSIAKKSFSNVASNEGQEESRRGGAFLGGSLARKSPQAENVRDAKKSTQGASAVVAAATKTQKRRGRETREGACKIVEPGRPGSSLQRNFANLEKKGKIFAEAGEPHDTPRGIWDGSEHYIRKSGGGERPHRVLRGKEHEKKRLPRKGAACQ